MKIFTFSRGAQILATISLLFLIFIIFHNLPSPRDAQLDHLWSMDDPESLRLFDQVQSLSAQLEQLKGANARLEKLNQINVDTKKKFVDTNTNSNNVQPKQKQAKLANVQNFPVGLIPPVVDQNYAKQRRFLEADIKEIGYMLRVQAKNMKQSEADEMTDLYRQIRGDLDQLEAFDGHSAFAEQELKELGTIVQNQIWSLQNPSKCSTENTMVYSISSECGFGCQANHIRHSLLLTYAMNRTLILDSHGWHYEPKGWEEIFMPLSDACQNHKFETAPQVIPMLPDTVDVFTLIPLDIRRRLERVHDQPHIWWLGQFMKFVLRLRPQTEVAMGMDSDAIFSKPLGGVNSSLLVGVHVRRTDKLLQEASFHSLDEYMVHADEIFEIFEKAQGNFATRNVFIASDDPTVLPEARQSYPNPKWEIMGNEGVANSASTDRRYSSNGLLGVLRDIFSLASCDFLVCTFSSLICRIPYELMQTKMNGGDHSWKFVSLDDVYYFAGGHFGSGQFYAAHVSHQPRNFEEIGLEVGDQIHLMGNHWNGLSKGQNERTGKVGLFPSYKIRRVLRTTVD